GRLPFPIMHVDTGHNFDEVLAFRDQCAKEVGARLIVASVQASIDAGRVVDVSGPTPSRNRLQTTTLLDAIEEHRFDAVFGGAHRRKVFRRGGMLLAVNPYLTLSETDEVYEATVRYRTVGDATCTGAVESTAATVEEVIAEVAASRITERGATRADDKFSEAA